MLSILRSRVVWYGAIYGVLLAIIYFTSYSWLVRYDWPREDYNYCYLIPLVVLYLIWEKRKSLLKEPSIPSWGGLALLLPGILLFWAGELAGEYYTTYLSSWLVLVGLLWLHLGWEKIKTISFPLVIALAMFPPPNFINNKLTFSLRLISSQLGVSMLWVCGMSAFREGNVIDLGFTQLQVVDACSGLRYLFPLVILGIIMAYFYRARMWKRILLVLFTVPLTITMNSLRIALTGIIYERVGAAAAESFFHGFSGWLLFMVCFGILIAGMWTLNRFFPEKKETAKSSNRVGSVAEGVVSGGEAREFPALGFTAALQSKRFVISAVLLGLTLIGANAIEFREKIPLKRSFAQFPLQVGAWSGARQQMEQPFIDTLNLSDHVIIDYQDQTGAPVNFYVAYYESQRKGESIHSPETCLPASGWIFHQAGMTTISLQGGKSMTVSKAIMEKGASRQLVYFWFPARGRVLNNAYELKLFGLWDAMTRQRTDGALVRVISPVASSERIEETDKRLRSFIGDIMPLLDEFIPE
jgi:exosortase D (VPLPA-CTERM-specific)